MKIDLSASTLRAMILSALFVLTTSANALETEGAGMPTSNETYPSSNASPRLAALKSSGSGVIRATPYERPDNRTFRPFTSFGFASRMGVGGFGFDVATSLSRKLNLRAGFDYFRYSFSFQEEGADITASLRQGSGHLSADWFPRGGRFRISPMMVLANNNRIHATAVIPAGSTLSINGQDYVSSATDPLHGSGTVTFRKTSPGLTMGFGNIIPRTRNKVSFPVEAGFYYVNQPRLAVDFSGSGCDPNYPADIGCQPVMDDPGFQKDLASFIKRNNHNLSYASFFPIFSVGFSYRF